MELVEDLLGTIQVCRHLYVLYCSIKVKGFSTVRPSFVSQIVNSKLRGKTRIIRYGYCYEDHTSCFVIYSSAKCNILFQGINRFEFQLETPMVLFCLDFSCSSHDTFSFLVGYF